MLLDQGRTSALRRHVASLFFVFAGLVSVLPLLTAQSDKKRRFSVRDDIAITQFGDVWMGERGHVAASPHGDLVVVHTTRGSLKDGKIHDELRVYDVAALKAFVNAPSDALHQEPSPLWTIQIAGKPSSRAGALIQDVRWLEHGHLIAFLRWTDEDRRQLLLADVDKKKTTELTDGHQDVISYDIRDENRYVFTVPSQTYIDGIRKELTLPFRVGTGKNSYSLIDPEQSLSHISRADLWAARGGKSAPVIDPHTGEPVFVYGDGSNVLSLSPDGNAVITIRAVPEVSRDWVARYLPPYTESAYRLRAGPQDLNAPDGTGYAGEFVLVSLDVGTVVSLTNAPGAVRAGWWEVGGARAVWSEDEASIFLPGTFAAKGFGDEPRPCFAVVRRNTGAVECVRPLKRNLAAGFEEGYAPIDEAWFVGGDDRIALKATDHSLGKEEISTYVRTADGRWQMERKEAVEENGRDLSIRVVTSFKEPPVLMASDRRSQQTRTIYDPNSQLKNLTLTTPELYNWSDGMGHAWRGILYKPAGYVSGNRYPLVIQNHGFSEDRFAPSGGFPSAFAAQELAANGIVVLQVRDCAGRSTPTEGICNVQEYESAVQRLNDGGMIDPSRIGLIGFSRTVYYVMEALTRSRLHFRAASITDGVDMGYADYLYMVGADPVYVRDQEGIFGGPPIGQDLLGWLRESPEFNLDRVTTPLRIVARRGGGINEMLEPYALLERAQKPVDLIVLNTDQHVITDPAVRFAAQEGNVDWFRFWLQDYEDPDPAKIDQYKRWRGLQKLTTQ
jgi:dipeptidyl aminopeptidase/acylaminoacyl peptidase